MQNQKLKIKNHNSKTKNQKLKSKNQENNHHLSLYNIKIEYGFYLRVFEVLESPSGH